MNFYFGFWDWMLLLAVTLPSAGLTKLHVTKLPLPTMERRNH